MPVGRARLGAGPAGDRPYVMRLEATTTDRRTRLIRNVALALAVVGVLHFVLSLVMWGVFYVGSYRNGWRNVLTLSYGVQHPSPAIVPLGLFAS